MCMPGFTGVLCENNAIRPTETTPFKDRDNTFAQNNLFTTVTPSTFTSIPSSQIASSATTIKSTFTDPPATQTTATPVNGTHVPQFKISGLSNSRSFAWLWPIPFMLENLEIKLKAFPLLQRLWQLRSTCVCIFIVKTLAPVSRETIGPRAPADRDFSEINANRLIPWLDRRFFLSYWLAKRTLAMGTPVTNTWGCKLFQQHL